jgi:hypothetical protein
MQSEYQLMSIEGLKNCIMLGVNGETQREQFQQMYLIQKMDDKDHHGEPIDIYIF